MGRFTRHTKNGEIIPVDWNITKKDYDKCLQKLAEYEDLEEQGKLIKLPCKVGDMVYVKVQSGEYAEAEVRDFTYFLTCGFCIVVTSEKFDKQNIPFTDFGKTVFLTPEEAKVALEKLEGENETHIKG